MTERGGGGGRAKSEPYPPLTILRTGWQRKTAISEGPLSLTLDGGIVAVTMPLSD